MRAASATHRYHSKKGAGAGEVSDERPKRGSSVTNASFLEELNNDTVVLNDSSDEEYNDASDHLVTFPPAAYRKGDIELGVLMSG
jgi:hypothetical protein